MVNKANPNVVPLCDILLVLLIIFMVITPLVQAGVDVRIPEGRGAIGDPIVLSIEREGLVTVNRQEFTDLAMLAKFLKDIYGSRTERTIFVQSHKDVVYKYVVQTIDAIKSAEVENICMMSPQDR